MTDHINTAWLANVKSADRQKTIDMVNNASPVLDLLQVIVTKEIASLDQTSSSDYDNPSWALKEADRRGQLRFAQKMLTILKRTT